MDNRQARQLTEQIKRRGRELGFQHLGISNLDLTQHEGHLLRWLMRGFDGEMGYMRRHGRRRSRPQELVPGTVRVISARMDYLPPKGADPWHILADGQCGYVSRYALGRDYHKLLRRRLQQLTQSIDAWIGPSAHRVFCDSAPVLEKALAHKAGLGWIGKHSNLLSQEAGSWFFLGEIYTDLPLPVDLPAREHCGSCRACLDACPTGAIVAPYQVDARRCISYHTIELHGTIPLRWRRAIGNRIYGCDDCQLVCPWNKFATPTPETDFLPRHGLDRAQLLELFAWDEATFLKRTEGSAIRRLGPIRWLRNIAVALGNAPADASIVRALQQRLAHPSSLLREHIRWALDEQHARAAGHRPEAPSTLPPRPKSLRKKPIHFE